MMTVRKIIALLLFALPVWLLVSCDTSEKDFEKAEKENTIESYEIFIQNHPESDLVSEAKDCIVSLFCRKDIKDIPTNYKDQEIANRLKVFVENHVDSLYRIAMQDSSVFGWKAYIEAVPQTYMRDAKERKSALLEEAYQKAEKENTITGWNAFINYVPFEDLRDANERRATLVEEAYQKAEKVNTIAGWKAFVDSVSSEELRDANERISELEEKAAWTTEPKAWQTVSTRGNTDAMKKYLELYPYGVHKKKVEKMLIDAEVSAVFNGEHGVLPQMDRGSRTGSSYSVIEIENSTEYDLTISYSGPDSKRMVIPPHKTRTMRIGNGNYRVAASVGHGVRPFAGSEKLDGRRFSSSFYISTIRY